MSGCGLWSFHLLGKLVHSACRELVKVHIAIIYCFRNKVLIFQKKPEDISVKYLACLWRVFGKIDLSLYHIIPLIYTSCTLPQACQQIKVGPYFICLELAKLFKMFQIVSKLRSSLGRLQDTYWSMPKSPLQSTTFLHFWHSGRAASSHLSLHFKILSYNPSFTVQSMWGLPCRACTWLEEIVWSLWVDCMEWHLCIWFLIRTFRFGHLELLMASINQASSNLV